jgi:hypothetical protein
VQELPGDCLVTGYTCFHVMLGAGQPDISASCIRPCSNLNYFRVPIYCIDRPVRLARGNHWNSACSRQRNTVQEEKPAREKKIRS